MEKNWVVVKDSNFWIKLKTIMQKRAFNGHYAASSDFSQPIWIGGF
jgi:hypothetical protein